MPPFGLYAVPRHHLYGGAAPTTRRKFNSMNFEEKTSKPVAPSHGGVIQPMNETEHGDGKIREKDKKKKKKHSLNTQDEHMSQISKTAPTTPVISATPAPSSSKSKKIKDKKNENGANDEHVPAKKRKRESQVHSDALVLSSERSNDKPALGPTFLEGLKATMGDLGATFGHPVQPFQTDEKPSKKKKRKSSSKHEQEDTKKTASEMTLKEEADNNNNLSEQITVKRKRGRPRKHPLTQVPGTPVKAPEPSGASPYISEPKHTPIPLPHKSPSGLTTTAALETSQKQPKTSRQSSHILVTETPPSKISNTLATFLSAPIAFNIGPSTTASDRKKSSKGPTLNISPPTTISDIHTPVSAPTTLPKTTDSSTRNNNNNIQTSLTASNLLRYTQPLNDKPKPRPRAASRSASVGASSATSSAASSSMSIIEAFARGVGKPYSRSGTELDPFTSNPSTSTGAAISQKKNKKKNQNKAELAKKHHEKHAEADIVTFTAAFRASRRTVNFSDEQEYLSAFLRLRARLDRASGGEEVPCLNRATGCNAKREELLRLSKEDAEASQLLQALVPASTNEGSARALETAVQSGKLAEEMLRLSVVARVPVPVGVVEGVWKLFCPAYSAVHVDVYGFGQRTLTIASVPTGTADGLAPLTYTARLSLPPRSMSYTLLPFHTPPHASFRSTLLKTSSEKYPVEVVFLGNGYAVVRMDLHLLLTGKSMSMAGEKGKGGKGAGKDDAKGMKKEKSVVKASYMEFIGVHAKAVKWTEERDERDELEEVGRRLFAKYDGGGSGDE
ncbi:Nn.00g101040.m01.CDS01 [Neocucurbitaria sp. VM-36]